MSFFFLGKELTLNFKARLRFKDLANGFLAHIHIFIMLMIFIISNGFQTDISLCYMINLNVLPVKLYKLYVYVMCSN